MSPITSSPTCSLKWVLVKRVSALLLQPGALQYESWLPLSAPSTTLSTRLLINSNPRVPRGHAGSQTGFGGLSIIAFQAWVMRVAALSQQGREGELCKGDWGHLRKASRARNDSAGAGQGRASASARGQEQRNLQMVSRSWAQNRSARPSVRSAPAPYVRAHVPRPSRKLSVARRRTLVVFAGSVYLRELRPPPAGAEGPREPGPEVWGEPRVVQAPSRPAQREKDLGVGTEEVPRRLPAPRSKPVPKSHEQLWHLLLKDRYSRLRQNKSLGRCAVEGCLRAFSGWVAGRRGSPSLALGGLCARTGLTLSVPNLRRATGSSVARAPCTPPSAQPWGSVGAAGACGAPGPLGAVGGARGCLRGGRCTEGWVRGCGRHRSIWTASCF